MTSTANRNNLRRVQFAMAAALGLLFASSAVAQLDATWTITIGGRSAPVNRDGTFTVRNIPTIDRDFPSDGIGNDPVRLTGISRFNGIVRFAVSEPFFIPLGGIAEVPKIIITSNLADLPLDLQRAFLLSITAVVEPNSIPEGALAQMTVTANLQQGGQVDATLATAQTTYLSSNPAIATVDPNGLVTGVSAGLVAITAANLGSTSVVFLRVEPPPTAPPTTTVEGFVQLEDGTPVQGANIALDPPRTETAVTGPDGSYSIPNVLVSDGPISLTATALIGIQTVSDGITDLAPVEGGLTDAGIITLIPPVAPPPPTGGGQVLVLSQGFTLEVVDLAKPCVSDNLGFFFSSANDIAVTADGSMAVLVGLGFNNPVPPNAIGAGVTFVDLMTNPPSVTGRMPIPGLFDGADVEVTCTPSGLAIVSSFNLGQSAFDTIASIDIATQTVVSTLALPSISASVVPFLAVTPDGSLILIPSVNDDSVKLVSLSPTGMLFDTGLSVPSGGSAPTNIAVSPDGRTALVANAGVFDSTTHMSSGASIGVLTLGSGMPSLRGTVPLERTPSNIVFTPDGSEAYVLGVTRFFPDDGVLIVLAVAPNGSVTDTTTRIPGSFFAPFSLFVGSGPDLIAASADGSSIIAPVLLRDGFSSSFGALAVVDTATKTIRSTIPLTEFLGHPLFAFSVAALPVRLPIQDAPGPDCNANGLRDTCETSAGITPDCNVNRVPDSCEFATMADCNANGVPDACEGGGCNNNRVPDSCDIASGTSGDCNTNGIPDECEGGCNHNRVPDSCDVDPLDPDGNGLVSSDCNFNGIPDECEDCNHNGLADECDLLAGTASDCNGNGIADSCEGGGCNHNGVPDVCDIAAGTSSDCNSNGIPDDCEDCNGNGLADDCELAAGTIPDCNSNGVPDTCDTLPPHHGFLPNPLDCNGNRIPDSCEVAAGTVVDCNANGIPDECDTRRRSFGIPNPNDCNSNRIPDSCDITAGTSVDVVGADALPDGIPDECQADCNGNRIPDNLDLQSGFSRNCNRSVDPHVFNVVPDECDIAAGTSADCDGNGIPDECDIRGVTGRDCNRNLIPDACDVVLNDCNLDGVPDDCLLETQKVTRPVGALGGFFGAPVAVDGSIGIISSRFVSGFASVGEVFVYRFNGVSWTEEALLAPSDGIVGGGFGDSVAVSGNTVIVGEKGHDAGSLHDVGAAYVFRFDGVEWVETAKLVAADGAGGDHFGEAVGIDGNLAVVGAPLAVTAIGNSGAAYVFRFDGMTWNQEATLTASDGGGNSPLNSGRIGLGFSVDISGEAVLVGAAEAFTPFGFRSGAVYVYRHNGIDWIEEAKLTASDITATGAAFGVVGLDGNVAIVGGFNTNAAYIYRYDGTTWTEEAKLVESSVPVLTRGGFGVSVAVEGNVALVGAPGDPHGQTGTTGAAFSFRYNGTAWVREPILSPSDARSDVLHGSLFGGSVSVSGNRAFVGAPGFGGQAVYTFTIQNHDCNGNTILDGCDIVAGTSLDINGNGVPDECEPDCNANGVLDATDIASGMSQDCDVNGVPDECDLTAGTASDCNSNGVPDRCEPDCNVNGITDECDLTVGTSLDCNANGIPDECDADCNTNGLPDDCDLTAGTSLDCNANGVPDECDADCNTNGLPDDCDLTAGTSSDCNANGIPDECDLVDGTSADCNANGIPDDCDLASGASVDVTGPGGVADGVPDECQTEVVGSVVDVAGRPVLGANVTMIGNRSGLTLSDGTFSFPGVPASLAEIIVTATEPVGGAASLGASVPLAPVAGGTTDVGIVVLRLVKPVPSVTLFGNFNGHGYYTTDALSTVFAARDVAAGLANTLGTSAFLVTINDQAEQDWINQRIGFHQGFWIGFSDELVEGTFVWDSGEPVTFTFWNAPVEPNNGTGNGNWTIMNGVSTGQWNDIDGNFRARAIIEVQ